MENALPIVRAALGLVGAAVAVALVMGRRHRHAKPTVDLGLPTPAASGAYSRAEAASEAK